MTQFIRYPSTSFNNSSVGTITAPIPTDATLVGFKDPSGNLQPGQINAAGAIEVASVSPDPGRTFVDSSDINYGTTNVTTGAWVQVIAALAGAANMVEIFDSSGEILELGVGAPGLEARVAIIFPGGNGQVPLSFAAGASISLRAITANATSAGTYNLLNFYS